MTLTVRVTVPADLKRALNANIRKVTERAALELANELKRTMSDYPPATAANLPNHRWYQRGYGPRWTRKGGGIGGSKTSEQLGQRWAVAKKRWGAIVGSPVSYSPPVQHHEEQSRVHKLIGWVTDKMAVDKLLKSGKVDRAVRAAVKWVLKGRG